MAFGRRHPLKRQSPNEALKHNLEKIMIRWWKISTPFALSTLALCLVGVAPAKAQAPEATRNTMVPAYDLTKEVKVQGTIEKIDGFGTNGPIGTHILIQTAAGTVDAHLGYGSASNPKQLGIAVGQSVSVIGMMETVGNSNVLMARILTTPSRIFVLRNEHGVPIRGVPRRNSDTKTLFGFVYPPTSGQTEWASL
jgi:hypothetical protein